MFTAFGSSFRLMCRLSTRLFQALRWWGRRKRVGKTRKRKARVAPPLPSFLPCLCSRFLNFRGPTAYAHRIFVVIGSLFLNIRLHLIWTIEKKEDREEEKSSSTVGVFVILDNVSSSPSFMVTWKATFSCTLGKVQYKCIVLLISLLLIIWKILYSMIFKQSISYRVVFIMILFRSRSPERLRLRAVSSFSLTLCNASTREGRAAKPQETRETHNLSSFFAPLSSPRLALRKNGQPFTVYIM